MLGGGGIVLLALNLRLAVSGIPPILGNLGIDRAGQAALVDIPVLCFALGAFAGPAIAERAGRRRSLVVIVALLCAGLIVRAAAPGAGLFPGTVLACSALALLNVYVPGLIHQVAPGRSASMTAAYTAAMAVGGAVAAAFTVPVLVTTGGSLTWALGFWALPAVVALIAWTPWGLGGSGDVALRRGPSLRTLLTSRRAWAVMAFFGLQSAVYYSVVSWLPTIYRDRGESALAAGALLGLLNIAGIAGNVAAPVVAMRTGRFAIAVGGTLGAVGIGLLGVLAAADSWAPLAVAMIGAGLGGAFSLSLLVIVDATAQTGGASSLSSFAQGGGYVITAVGPPAVGLAHGFSGQWTIPLLALVAVTVAALAIGLRLDADALTRGRPPLRPGTHRQRPGA